MSSKKTTKLPTDILPKRSEDYFYENGETLILPIVDFMDETPELGELNRFEGLGILNQYLCDVLTPKDLHILQMRFGLGEYFKPMSFGEIGNVIDTSEWMIQSRIQKSLSKLRKKMSVDIMDYFV